MFYSDFLGDELKKKLSNRIPKNFYEMTGKNLTMSITRYFLGRDENKDIVTELNDVLKQYPWMEKTRNIVYAFMNNWEVQTCKECGKIVKFHIQFQKRTFCSSSCISKNSDVRKKVENTFVSRYGAIGFASDELAEKSYETSVKKHGVKYGMQVKGAVEKASQTMLKKFGSKHALQNKEILQKCKNTTMEHYGVENAFQSEEIKEKSKQTCNKKYGADFYTQSDEGRKRLIEKMLKNYEDENIKQRILDKIRQTCIERFGTVTNLVIEETVKRTLRLKYDRMYDNIVNNWKDYVIPMFSKEEYKGKKIVYKWKCVKCGKEFESNIHTNCIFDINTLRDCPRCLHCYPYDETVGKSKIEKELFEFIASIYDGKIIENDRTVLNSSLNKFRKQELDIYIPELKIAFEMNGVYWHCEENTDLDYHYKKSENCRDNGIFLFHVFEDEWRSKNLIVKSKIKELFGIFKRSIDAQDCKFDIVKKDILNKFVLDNHINGFIPSQCDFIGMFYDNELVGVMAYQYKNIKYIVIKNEIYIKNGIEAFILYLKNKTGSSIITIDIDESNEKLEIFEKICIGKEISKNPIGYYVISNSKKIRIDDAEGINDYLTKQNSQLENHKKCSILKAKRIFTCRTIKYFV